MGGWGRTVTDVGSMGTIGFQVMIRSVTRVTNCNDCNVMIAGWLKQSTEMDLYHKTLELKYIRLGFGDGSYLNSNDKVVLSLLVSSGYTRANSFIV